MTDADVALSFYVMDDFERLNKEITYEVSVSIDENQSHSTISSVSDRVESLRNGFILNDSQSVFDVPTKNSESVCLQDRNFANISATSLQSDNSSFREKDCLLDFENVEEMIDIYVKASETEEGVQNDEPIFSLLDVFSPLENHETSLFPPLVPFSSSTRTDCCDNISPSFIDFSGNSLASSYAVCCGENLPESFSNETASVGYSLLTSDNPSDVSSYITEPVVQKSEHTLGIDGDLGSMQISGQRERSWCARKRSRSSRKPRKSKMKRKTFSLEKRVPSVSDVQLNASAIGLERLPLCPMSQEASEQVRLVASGSGYVSEYAKFVHSLFNNRSKGVRASECPQDFPSHPVTQTTEFQNNEIKKIGSQSKRKCVGAKGIEVSKGCLVDLSFTTRQTSSKRFIQKPACACCLKMSEDSQLKKDNNSRKRQYSPAKHKGRVKDTEKCRRHLQYAFAIDAYTTCQEQLRSLQRKLFHLLHVLFPFLADWKYIRPHSHSLELLIDKITDSLRNSSLKTKSVVWQSCCPIITLCRFPALCLRSLQQKATVLINLLIPSLHIGDTEHDQLEMIIDQLIACNAGCLDEL